MVFHTYDLRKAGCRISATILVFWLTGCAQPAADVAPPVQLVAVPTGVQVVGTGREIGFGRDWIGVEQTMTRLRGAPDRREVCGAGEVVVWGGLGLRRAGHRFVGLECPLQ